MRKLFILFFIITLYCTELFSENANNYFNRAENYFKDRKYKDAIYYYKKSVEKNPYYTIAIYKIGKSYYSINRIDNAIKYYKKALNTNPNYLPALNSIGYAYISKGKNSTALSYFKKALDISPLNYDALVGMARVYFIYSDYEKSENYLKQALSRDKSRAEAYIQLSHIYVAKRKYKKALSLLNTALRYNPQEYKIYLNKGLVYKKKGDLIKSKNEYEKAYSINSDDISVILNLSELYIKRNDWRKAVKFLEKTIKVYPNVKSLYSKLAFAYQMINKNDKALENLRKVVNMDINDDILVYHYENLLIKNRSLYNPERIKEAKKHFTRAKKFLNNNNRYDAITEYRRALQLYSDNWQERYNLALLYKKMGQLGKYLKELKIAIKLNPSNVNLKDKLEFAERFRYKRLSYKLDIDQYSVPKDKIKILILNFVPIKDKYLYIQSGKIIADSINNHLRSFAKFKVYSMSDNKYYRPYSRNNIRILAEKLNADYFVYGSFEENENYISLKFNLYSTKEDEPIKEFKTTLRGKNKLYKLSKDIARQMNDFFPVYGHILEIKDNNIIINIGFNEGIKKGDTLGIYGGSNLVENYKYYTYDEVSKGKKCDAKIVATDEEISIARTVKKWDINKVSINDRIKVVKKRKKK